MCTFKRRKKIDSGVSKSKYKEQSMTSTLGMFTSCIILAELVKEDAKLIQIKKLIVTKSTNDTP